MPPRIVLAEQRAQLARFCYPKALIRGFYIMVACTHGCRHMRMHVCRHSMCSMCCHC